MTSLRSSAFALFIALAAASAGCLPFGADVTLDVLEAVSKDGSHSAEVNRPVDRMMTRCELERGEWREKHQDQDEVPPALECTPDGGYRYPPGSSPPPAVTATPAPVPPPETPAVPPPETPGRII
jgi:hypothetical protein